MLAARALASREREALCDLALEVGPLAPTMWSQNTVEELVARLLVTERLYVAPVHGDPETRRLEGRQREAARGFEAMVERLRHPGLAPRVTLAARRLSAMELALHHEDVRRAQPGVDIARRVSDVDDDVLWRQLKRVARPLLRRHAVPVVLLRSDPPRTRWTAVRGGDPVIIKGKPLELVLAVHGRRRLYNVAFDGPRRSVFRVRDNQY